MEDSAIGVGIYENGDGDRPLSGKFMSSEQLIAL